MIEIEKKFILTDQQKQRLLDGAKPNGQKLVVDSYLDTDDYQLTLQDLWFRLRDGSYELKAPLTSGHGDESFTNRFHELTDINQIAETLGLPVDGDFETNISQAGIKKFITCYTDRSSYDKDGFHIDIDTVTYLDSDFEYAVAEIELLIADESGADAAEKKIVDYAKHLNLTTDQVILGKVAVYLKVERPAHYAALVKAGIFH